MSTPETNDSYFLQNLKQASQRLQGVIESIENGTMEDVQGTLVSITKDIEEAIKDHDDYIQGLNPSPEWVTKRIVELVSESTFAALDARERHLISEVQGGKRLVGMGFKATIQAPRSSPREEDVSIIWNGNETYRLHVGNGNTVVNAVELENALYKPATLKFGRGS